MGFKYMQNCQGLLKEIAGQLICRIPGLDKISSIYTFIEFFRTKYQCITDQIFLNKLEAVLIGIEEPLEQNGKSIVDSFQNWLCEEGKVEQFLLWISNIKNKDEIVYFANLVRCACVNNMDSDLFMIQLNFLQSISLPAIQYLERYPIAQRYVERNYYVTSLYWHGLFNPVDIGEKDVVYAITELGIIFKRCCLNYNAREEINCKRAIELSPVDVPEPTTRFVTNEFLKMLD